ncbi:MAG TPA: UDP-N-acetylmuramoyl-L-alanine--D-glutamate ligase [Candidatus Nanoarchaeia archaeon]
MNFKDKKVAVIGAGVEGSSSAAYLISKGANVVLLDKKSEEQFGTGQIKEIRKLPIKLVLGEGYLSNLSSFDFIFRSPGIRPDLPEFLGAKKKGAVVTSQTKLFFDLCKAPIIGVTGTKGKGTTSALTHEILKAAGKKVFLGGNIGKPPLDFVDKATADSLVVLELSSFQLMDMEKSPHIAVVLMTTCEHLDWHRDEREYVEAKERVVKFQSEEDFLVINADNAVSKKLGGKSKANKYYFSIVEPVNRGAYVDKDFVVSVTDGWTTITNINDIQILGEHNLQNICAAVVVAGILETPPDIVHQAIVGFKGLPHRLESVAEKDGVKFYNDSASTAPETTIAAIHSFGSPKILILGGSSKGSDFTQLGREIVKSDVKAVILIGQEAKRIKGAINTAGRFSGEFVEGLKTMQEIVEKAKNLSKPGDVVLLSPACASFDMFKNYPDRGDQFKEAVKLL